MTNDYEDEPSPIITWGRYAGKRLCDIDNDSYLQWLHKEAAYASDLIKAHAEYELLRREGRKKAKGY